MRLASFNVENLFARARALNSDDWVEEPGNDPWRWSAGQKALNAYSSLNKVLRKAVYSPADKIEILALLATLGITRNDASDLVILRKNRGALLRRSRDAGPVEVIANGRDDWIGWLDLKKEAVNENRNSEHRTGNQGSRSRCHCSHRGGRSHFAMPL